MANLPRDTDRLSFRHLNEADLDDLADLYADPEVVRFVGRYERGELRQWLAENRDEVATRGHGRVAIVARADGEFLGRTGLKYRPRFGEVEVDWSLRPAARGRGIATEAGAAALAWAFELLEVEYVTAMIEPENESSIAVAERLGMSLLRRDRLDGVDLLVYSISRSRQQD